MSSEMKSALPKGWQFETIANLADSSGTFVDGDWVESKDQDSSGDVRLIQLADIGDGKFRDRSDRYLTSIKAKELNCTFLQVDDLLIARMPDPLGRACIFPGDKKKAVTVVDVCIVRPNRIDLSNRWLMYAINSPEVRAEIATYQSGSTRKRISRTNLAKIKLPIPPISEQDRIVAKIEELLTRLDAGVAALKRAQANLKRYKASVLKAACEGRLVPQDPSDEPAEVLLQRILAERRAKWAGKGKYVEPQPPDTRGLPELPKGWCWASLDQTFQVERGKFSVRPRNDPRYYGGEYPFVQIGDLPRDGGAITNYTQTLNDQGLTVSKCFKKGSALIAIVGATIANTGVLTFDSCCPDSLVAIQASDELRIRFVEIYLQSKKLEIRKTSYASGGQPNINLGTLLPYAVPVPPLDEQYRIVAEVENRLSRILSSENLLNTNLVRAERMRQAILRRAFRGELV